MGRGSVLTKPSLKRLEWFHDGASEGSTAESTACYTRTLLPVRGRAHYHDLCEKERYGSYMPVHFNTRVYSCARAARQQGRHRRIVTLYQTVSFLSWNPILFSVSFNIVIFLLFIYYIHITYYAYLAFPLVFLYCYYWFSFYHVHLFRDCIRDRLKDYYSNFISADNCDHILFCTYL